MSVEASNVEKAPGWLRATWLAIILAFLIILAAIALDAWQRYRIVQPVQAALAGENSASVSVYHRGLLGGQTTVIDVQEVSAEASEASITRLLLKTARALHDQDLNRVSLASYGQVRFYLEGADFKRIAEEQAWEDLDYATRMLPDLVKTPDGKAVFRGVGAGAERSRVFHNQWWGVDVPLRPISV